jgi:UDP-N-acetylmuramyl pentapeptide phosphotransferase/UDP-N-acetylglucosamine-1-phosphate transferase
VAFTAFAVGGVANAINIVDGFNGLASSSAIIAFLGYGAVAASVGDAEVAQLCLALAAVVAGFFLVNWPMGKLFLGDGGSYFIGFNLAWVSVLLARHESVNAFALLLVCVHPVTEVLFSVFRRRVRKEHPGHPDRLHFHSLVNRRYVRRWFPNLSARLQNSVTGLLVGSMTVTAAIGATVTYHSVPLALCTWLALVLGYIALYARMVRFHWCSPIAMLLSRPPRAVLIARMER